MQSRPRQPIIGGRGEAALNVAGRVLMFVGLVLVVWGQAAGVVVFAFGALFTWRFLAAVSKRIGVERQDRAILRRWIGMGALYRSLVTLARGNDGTLNLP